MLTPLYLIDLLAEYLEKNLSEFTYQTNGKNEKIRVMKAYPEVRKSKDANKIPLVLVQCLTGKSENDKGILSTADVRILVGVEDVDDEGWKSIYNIVERIRQLLLKENIIAGFPRLLPVKWNFDEDQPYPKYFAQITVTFNIASLNPEV